jgi:hypothetical protein
VAAVIRNIIATTASNVRACASPMAVGVRCTMEAFRMIKPARRRRLLSIPFGLDSRGSTLDSSTTCAHARLVPRLSTTQGHIHIDSMTRIIYYTAAVQGCVLSAVGPRGGGHGHSIMHCKAPVWVKPNLGEAQLGH